MASLEEMYKNIVNRRTQEVASNYDSRYAGGSMGVSSRDSVRPFGTTVDDLISTKRLESESQIAALYSAEQERKKQEELIKQTQADTLYKQSKAAKQLQNKTNDLTKERQKVELETGVSIPATATAYEIGQIKLNQAGKLKSQNSLVEVGLDPAKYDLETFDGRALAYKDVIREKTSKSGTPDGLDDSQIFAAKSLARKKFGTRNFPIALPTIYALLKSGKTIDEIEDDERFKGQSEAFIGPVRNAATSALIADGAGERKMEIVLNSLDDLWSTGQTKEAKNRLKLLARVSAGKAQQSQIMGKERTVEFLEEIRGDLLALEQAGIETNIFSGTTEKMFGKVGKVKNAELRTIANKVATAIQNYRKSMTGVAFSQMENKEYKRMFPNIDKTGEFNMAVINGLVETFEGDLSNFYKLKMGEESYNALFGDVPFDSMLSDNVSDMSLDELVTKSGFSAEQLKEARSLYSDEEIRKLLESKVGA